MNPQERIELVVPAEQAQERLDVFVAQALSDLTHPIAITRSQVQRMIRQGAVEVAGETAIRPAQRVFAGQRVWACLPQPETSTALPEDIPLDVVFEDQYLLVINKPRGMVVHPAAGHRSGTLVNAVLARCPELHREQGTEPIRPGIVHRLDRDTTGLIVVAKDAQTRLDLTRLIRERELSRTYLALVLGPVSRDQGEVNAAIDRSRRDRKRMAVTTEGGRTALTTWHRLNSFGSLDLLEVKLHTGRTHQIRVHLAHIGHPVAGDPVYGPGQPARHKRLLAKLAGQALHAWRLGFVHPRTGQDLELQAALPDDLATVLVELYRGSGLAKPSWLGCVAQSNP